MRLQPNGHKENQDARRANAPLRFLGRERGLRGAAPPLVGSGNWFPARGVQRTLAVLWPPEAPPAGVAGESGPFYPASSICWRRSSISLERLEVGCVADDDAWTVGAVAQTA